MTSIVFFLSAYHPDGLAGSMTHRSRHSLLNRSGYCFAINSSLMSLAKRSQLGQGAQAYVIAYVRIVPPISVSSMIRCTQP
ncbi:hypothetical protein K503DRAFT_26597 [Rhizopogon vinicolor AM-OR11-026]|uniref:Uncharacterized protein n=1 Tax=Rhizopogon vinicolor AM-OR11-026 TaxID=1314800 RepID=A0A1B7MHE1_9AGAM|nr:hypothetical protein K503DRAFT_26597 [Rhizopogon vinicolor AM-OR11-026]